MGVNVGSTWRTPRTERIAGPTQASRPKDELEGPVRRPTGRLPAPVSQTRRVTTRQIPSAHYEVPVNRPGVRLNNQLEVVFDANDGGIRVAWRTQNGVWPAPVGISPANLTPAGAQIALQYYPMNIQ